MFHVAMSMLLVVSGTANKPLKYEEAFAKASKEKKPLVILVGAKWCASCQIMKRETMEPMKKSGALNAAVVTYVDKDERPELAEKLMRGETLPQVIVYSKKTGKWKRFSLTGMQSEKRMVELIGRANGGTVGQQIIR